MPIVNAWTDGGCSPNPGLGGWGVVLQAEVNGDLTTKELSGAVPHATNNEMELTAVEMAVKALRGKGHTLVIHTDSQLVIGWLQDGWKCKQNHNRQIIGRICGRASLGQHTLEFVKIKGHSGDRLNERADELAVQAREKYAAERAALAM